MGREVAQSGVKVAQYEKRCSVRRKGGSSGGWMAQLVGEMVRKVGKGCSFRKGDGLNYCNGRDGSISRKRCSVFRDSSNVICDNSYRPHP
jgi:hypothetical protein